VILEPVNDGECLGQLTRIAREQARTSTAYNLAARLRTAEAVVKWLQSLPQRDDDGRETLQVIQCDVPQRVRIFPGDPNCFERTLAALILLEVIDPKTPRVAVTIEKPLRHTALAELVGGQWRVVDLFPRRNGKPIIVSSQRNAAGFAFDAVPMGVDEALGTPRPSSAERPYLGIRRDAPSSSGGALPDGWRDPFASAPAAPLPPDWRDPWALSPEQEALLHGSVVGERLRAESEERARRLPPPPPAVIDELGPAQRWGAVFAAESAQRVHYRDCGRCDDDQAHRNLSAQDRETGKQVVGVVHGIGKGILGAFGMGALGDLVGQGWQAAGLLDAPTPPPAPQQPAPQQQQAPPPPQQPAQQQAPLQMQKVAAQVPPTTVVQPPPVPQPQPVAPTPPPTAAPKSQGGSLDAHETNESAVWWWPPTRGPRQAAP
jgi:hypothetical protein